MHTGSIAEADPRNADAFDETMTSVENCERKCLSRLSVFPRPHQSVGLRSKACRLPDWSKFMTEDRLVLPPQVRERYAEISVELISTLWS